MNLGFDDRDGLIWWNGTFVDWRDANVHVLNQGLHYASSVFEGERAYQGRIFRSLDHSRRLIHSAKRLDMDVSFSLDDIESAKQEILARSGLSEAYIRPVIFRGSGQMGISVAGADVHFAIAVWHWENLFENRSNGVRLTFSSWRRPPTLCAPADAKAAGLYMICTLAKNAAEASGFDDALMLDVYGNIAESTGANIFFVRDGELHTPRPDCFLNGITRQTIIELAKDLGLEVIERSIHPDELSSFTECFVTGSAAEVTPVQSVAQIGYEIGDVSTSLMDAYRSVVTMASPNLSIAKLLPN
ncbi:MAG: branched-chain amino acid aminotransferase [Pseudomonadota bacterium]